MKKTLLIWAVLPIIALLMWLPQLKHNKDFVENK